MVRKILNVAEKHDVAKTISNILSRNHCERKMIVDKKYKFFEYNFDGGHIFPNSQMIFTHVAGHLYNFEFPTEFNNWFSTPFESLFTCPLINTPYPDFVPIINAIKKYARECQQLIIWTDCDREGENIGFEIINSCLTVNRNIQISRAKFSDLNERSIVSACRNLEPPNKKMSDAVEARKELDFRIGCTFTRMQSSFLKSSITELKGQTVISYGPCQFPTLGFIVDRYNEIKNFIPETFWKIILKHKKNNIETNFQWARNHLFLEEACQAIFEDCQDAREAIVVSCTKKPKSKYRPQPMYTVEFEKLASKHLKMSSKTAMAIAERLYSRGFVSYPRTETNMFSASTNINELVRAQTASTNWGDFANEILSRGANPRNGTKSDNAHPPIHPVKFTTELTGEDFRVYDLITRHFLACCSYDASGQETKVVLKLGSETFTGTGLQITDRGYLKVYPFEKWSDNEIAEYKKGEKFIPTVLSMEKGETSPPQLLTESDLISLMEKYQIGTDATHAEHIETIQTREYANKITERFLPTVLGMGLIEGYKSMGFDSDENDLGKPFLRAELEAELVKIVDGIASRTDIVNKFIGKYSQIFRLISDKKYILKNVVEKYLKETTMSNETAFTNSDKPNKGVKTLGRPPKSTNKTDKKPKTETKNKTQTKTTPTKRKSRAKKTEEPQLMCKCNQTARYGQVQSGINKGKFYWGCSKPRENSCNFFKWDTAKNQS